MKEYKRFILLSLLWAWTFYGINIATGAGVQGWGLGLVMLGGISPAVAAGVLLSRREAGAVRGFLRSLVDIPLIPPSLLFFVALFPLLLLWLAIGGAALLFPGLPAFTPEHPFKGGMVSGALFVVTVFFFGPLPEEIGWRGSLLPALYRYFSLRRSALAIALVWGLWHLPLFFINGYPLAQMRSHPWLVMVYFAMLFPKSFVFAWLFVRTNKSILACILFHFFINCYGMTWQTATHTQYFELLLWTLFALALQRDSAVWGTSDVREEKERRFL